MIFTKDSNDCRYKTWSGLFSKTVEDFELVELSTILDELRTIITSNKTILAEINQNTFFPNQSFPTTSAII